MLSPTYEITTALSHTGELISPPYDIAIVTISYGRVIMSSVWDSMMSKKNVGWPFYAAVVRKQYKIVDKLASLCSFSLHIRCTAFVIHTVAIPITPLKQRQMTTKKHPDSPAYRLFVQQFGQAAMKGNIKAPHHWPFVKGIHRWPVDSLNKRPVMRKVFPLPDVVMTLWGFL